MSICLGSPAMDEGTPAHASQSDREARRTAKLRRAGAGLAAPAGRRLAAARRIVLASRPPGAVSRSEPTECSVFGRASRLLLGGQRPLRLAPAVVAALGRGPAAHVGAVLEAGA